MDNFSVAATDVLALGQLLAHGVLLELGLEHLPQQVGGEYRLLAAEHRPLHARRQLRQLAPREALCRLRHRTRRAKQSVGRRHSTPSNRPLRPY
eukprot:8726281-Pyramimonas_sp.AAC.2